MTDNLATITINGVVFGGWTSVSIARSLEQAAGSFKLTVSERFPGEDRPIGIKPGVACVVAIDKDVVISGYVDTVAISYEATAHTITVSGRSKTQDLIDCAVLPPWSPMKEQTIVQVANILAEPYKIDIVDAVGKGIEPIAKVKINPGETVLQALSRLANVSGVMLTDDAKGRLLITRAGSERATTRLEMGQNILSGSGTFDHQQRFQEYRVIGQGSMVAENQISATALDEGVARKRVHIVRGEGKINAQQAEDRARWESASRSGKSSKATYTVQGWRQEGGALWAINQLVTVKDNFLSLDGTFLISGVTFTLSDRGTITTLDIVPPAAFVLKPPVPSSATEDASVWNELKDEDVVQ